MQRLARQETLHRRGFVDRQTQHLNLRLLLRKALSSGSS
jgi:hypothetical protein